MRFHSLLPLAALVAAFASPVTAQVSRPATGKVPGPATTEGSGSTIVQVSRPPCREVLRQVNKEVSAREGNPASPRAVAKSMGIEPEWVRRCMEAYGRVPSERTRESDTDREAYERAVEEGRPMAVDEDSANLRYDRLQEQRLERQELRARQKKLREEKEFEDSAESFDFPQAQY